MTHLVESIRKVITELESREDWPTIRSSMVRAFNNEKSIERSRNRRPRTALMVKGLKTTPFQEVGLVAKAAALATDRPENKLHFERHMDIKINCGQWWKGQYFCLLAAEVENNWNELRGTICDLCHCQSRHKWGVFYHPSLDAAEKELIEATIETRKYFRKEGFQESNETSYELVVLPNQLPPSGMRGIELVELSFQANTEDSKLKLRKRTI